VSTVAVAIASAYADADYAASLAEFGRPRALPASGGWLLDSDVPGGGRCDAAGCYPLFQCRRWSGLTDDLEELADEPGGPVAVTLVADPLGDHAPDQLRRQFPDLCRPFKDHHLVDLDRDPLQTATAHHRRNARRAARHFAVEICDRPVDHLDVWVRLYRRLCRRHDVTGVAAFSRRAFARQLALPGVLLVRACENGDPVAMQIWLTAAGRAWYHLSASDERGYRWGGAAYAMTAAALSRLREEGVGLVDLGGGAGATDSQDDSLVRFKAGWATRTRPAWLCGRVLDRAAYDFLAEQHGDGSAWFPAYRAARGRG